MVMEIEDIVGRVHEGDAIVTLKRFPDSFIHCAITSPPYFGMRDYNHPDQVGREETYEDYIQYLVRLGRELRRVLRGDANFFLNIGDKFCQKKSQGLKPKDKMLIPHRVAIALQEDGWYVRGNFPWIKNTAKPSPAKDRLIERKEFVFHLTTHKDYFFDLDGIREPHSDTAVERAQYGVNPGKHETEEGRKTVPGTDSITHSREGVGKENIAEKITDDKTWLHPLGKNPGDVIETAPERNLHDTHFSVFPLSLIEKPLKAGTPQRVCSECGTPYERPDPKEVDLTDDRNVSRMMKGVRGIEYRIPAPVQQCQCRTDVWLPGIILDPFLGSGTVGIAARKLNRRWIGIDINSDYCKMARRRIQNTPVTLDRYVDSSRDPEI